MLLIEDLRDGWVLYEKDCIFCQILHGRKEADFIYRDERLAVFRDIYPAAPVHLLIVPQKHIRSINDLADEESGIIGEMILRARDMARQAGVASSGYKLLINTERGAGQVIFHLHLHLIGGWHRAR